MRTTKCLSAVLGLAWAVMGVAAGESYRVVALGDLGPTGAAKEWGQAMETSMSMGERMWRPALRCAVTAYLGLELGEHEQWNAPQSRLRLALALPDATAAVTGFVDLLMPGGELREFPFTLDPAKFPAADAAEFGKIRQLHFERLAHHHLPGTGWFRHLAGESETGRRIRDFMPAPRFADSFAVLSGGRAVAENLALDRELILPDKPDGATVKVADIPGVTVKPIDWTGKLPAGKEVAVDALAAALPVDQHALFVPSMAALFELIRVTQDEGMPVAQEFTVRNPFRKLVTRYRGQMGLDFSEMVARLLPVKGVAVTGGDPFFPSGTDVAVVFEPKDATALHAALLTAIKVTARAHGATETDHSGEGYTCAAFVTPDRGFSSYVLRSGDLVAVTNSPAQVTRLMAVKQGTAPALGSTDEFHFFRNRYPLGEAATGLLFLSDETLRRWAGPVTRIGASRRTRAVAALMELTARLTEGQPLGEDFQALLGPVERRGERVWSTNFGTLGFITPTAELGIETATARELAAYDQWRRGYESGWAQVFDPIALRLDCGADHRGLDLTVLPLTLGSDYQEMARIVGNATLSPQARAVPAGARAFLSLALDRESKLFRDFDVKLVDMLPSLKLNPLGWMGSSVTLWLEDGMDLAMLGKGRADFDMLALLPLGLRVESTSSLKLALFLTGVKSSVNSSAPNLVTWETRQHGQHSYIRVQGDERQAIGGITIFYAPMKGALLVALDEEVLKRAMDREVAGLPAALADQLPPARHLLAEISPAELTALRELMDDRNLTRQAQEESWKALPVLNEWHRRQPAADPVKLEAERFATDVFCPGGKGYRWNAAAMTMESVAYGHPTAPREDAAPPALLTKFQNLRTALDFADDGLRVRASLGPVGPRQSAVVRPVGELLGHAKDFVVADPQRRQTYECTVPDGTKKSLPYQPSKVKVDGDALEFSVDGKDGERVWSQTCRLAGDLRLILTGDSQFGFQFAKGELQLPAELIAGAVHQETVNGKWRSEGKEVDCVAKTLVRVIGRETVEVPAGAFEDCVRVETVTRRFASALRDPGVQTTLWYHRNTGVVKTEVRTPGGVFTSVLTTDERVPE